MSGEGAFLVQLPSPGSGLTALATLSRKREREARRAAPILDITHMTDIPENALVARQMYAEGASVEAILAKTGLPKHKLYFWLDGGRREDGRRLLPQMPRRLVRARQIKPREQLILVTRMFRLFDKQIAVMESRENSTATEDEQDSRRMALITRALEQIGLMPTQDREMARRKKTKNDQSQAVEQPVPRDPEELRRSLARKLGAIIAEEEGEIPRDA